MNEITVNARGEYLNHKRGDHSRNMQHQQPKRTGRFNNARGYPDNNCTCDASTASLGKGPSPQHAIKARTHEAVNNAGGDPNDN